RFERKNVWRYPFYPGTRVAKKVRGAKDSSFIRAYLPNIWKTSRGICVNGAAPHTDDRRPAQVPASPAFIDGHVHIYPHVALPAVFDAIEQNVRREGFEQCVLLLAEPRGVEGFMRLLRLGEEGRECAGLPAWKVLSKGDDQIDVRHDDGFRAVFLRGQQ